ncbi:GNAT family N-acetyltransferase [Nonomuraea sp. SYSU D8015]|uniref:GNAT family N-acetyltransferase n=1 Tax=Nonomuraea sp. SYSU D8015 TaxID=2593644 RepID=UPI0016616727|nr:GNAT family N-acetyltransferase [Nonomuraea sp. SYSU D8015]
MHAISRPRLQDAVAIHELVAAYDTAVIGRPDMTLDDIADELVEPGFDRDRDGWLVHDADGTLLAWAWACANGDSDLVEIEVIVRPGADGLAGELLRTVTTRARELAAERGHDHVTADLGVYRADHAKQALAKEHGFEPATSFHRMRIDHDGPVEPPAPPAGLTLETGESDEVRREAHRVQQEGFAQHFGFVKVDYEPWYERRQAMSVTDWSQLTLARLDGRPAGVLIGNNQFVADEDCGYVATLAVLPEFRGRGLGRFLLSNAFAADAARGRKGTILHVDSNNTTPALGLYESAGMRQVLAIDVWRRRL